MMSVAATSVATAIKSTAVITGVISIPSAAGRIGVSSRTPFATIKVDPDPVAGTVLMKGAATSGFATLVPSHRHDENSKNANENCGFHNWSSTKDGAQNV
ncbi:hypothetical protein TRM7557_00594 [Tritonibacter multivorans]|uniref:Uncharacterized protein n=1 Tax=Tritonibacter multivorans TaxID=928856 RepID=A0A0P1G275_9RHOB|nr:hypothetical protein [Tritonibacter multivorans]MDA7419630.1 hypothetical protein [Tritonibacter multivorans]CUH75862.1 hypothetical protein TRM7557_00594 [Tritonibacter multivorans]SFC59766.1 hypothetical protein SAMN04488049_103188 [Tritonibacter multivorans]